MDRSSRRVCFATSTQYLSDDLISTILTRLPAKSLLRFRGVCKSWRSLISSEEFIGSHLKQQQSHTLTTFDPLLGYHHGPDRFTNNFYLVRYNQLRSHDELCSPDSSFQIYPPGIQSEGYRVRQIGFCDGIVCLLCGETTVMICNPSMRKSATISVPEIADDFDLVYYGFGHDALNDDYKIVRLFIKYNSSTVEVKVYSFKSRTWKLIVNDLLNILRLEDRSCLAGGHIHWVAKGGPSPFLLSFDLTHEVFRQMELPLRSYPGLLFYDLLPNPIKHGKVSLLAWNHRKNMSSVWELGELGVAGSWSELHPTGEPLYNAVALGLENSPNRTRRWVIHSCDGEYLDSTELESGKVRHHCCLEIRQFYCGNSTLNGFANYMESLVMLNYDNTTCTSLGREEHSLDKFGAGLQDMASGEFVLDQRTDGLVSLMGRPMCKAVRLTAKSWA